MRPFPIAAVLLVLALAVSGEEAPAGDSLASLQSAYDKAYAAGAYGEALDALLRLAQRAEVQNNRDMNGRVAFRTGCMYARLGDAGKAISALRQARVAGVGRLEIYLLEEDLEPIRNHPEFRLFLSELNNRAQFGTMLQARPRPLVWDAAQPAPPFALVFDDPASEDLRTLRAEFRLDDVVNGATDSYDQLVRMTKWTSEQWQHHPSNTASKRDPLTILREARGGGRFLCHDYAVALAGAERAFGLYARHVVVLPKDVEVRSELHSIVEVWLPKREKWAMADPQFGIVPEVSGVPLSALELQVAIAGDAPIVCRGASERCREWMRQIEPNLYYFKIAQDQRRFGSAPSRQLVLVPKGAPEPRRFAGGNEQLFADAIYTSNPDTFYAPPSQAASPTAGKTERPDRVKARQQTR